AARRPARRLNGRNGVTLRCLTPVGSQTPCPALLERAARPAPGLRGRAGPGVGHAGTPREAAERRPGRRLNGRNGVALRCLTPRRGVRHRSIQTAWSLAVSDTLSGVRHLVWPCLSGPD